MILSIDWKQLAGAISVIAILNGAYIWVLYHVLRDKMDGVYMTKEKCEANHKVTDMALVNMRDDISEMKDTNNKILEILLEASNVIGRPKKRNNKR